MISLLLLATLVAASPPSDAAGAPEAWLKCMGAAFESDLASGASAAWPVAPSLPAGAAFAYVDLPQIPAGPAYDAVQYELRLYQGGASAYVVRRGGISDTRVIHGPISTQGRCPMPVRQ